VPAPPVPESEEMRAVSVHAPWAWAIMHGYKDYENRNFQVRRRDTTLEGLPFTLAFFSTGSPPDAASRAACLAKLRSAGYEGEDPFDEVPLRRLVCVVRVVAYVAHAFRIQQPFQVPGIFMMGAIRLSAEVSRRVRALLPPNYD
jgi:hypothetical protein